MSLGRARPRWPPDAPPPSLTLESLDVARQIVARPWPPVSWLMSRYTRRGCWEIHLAR